MLLTWEIKVCLSGVWPENCSLLTFLIYLLSYLSGRYLVLLGGCLVYLLTIAKYILPKWRRYGSILHGYLRWILIWLLICSGRIEALKYRMQYFPRIFSSDTEKTFWWSWLWYFLRPLLFEFSHNNKDVFFVFVLVGWGYPCYIKYILGFLFLNYQA